MSEREIKSVFISEQDMSLDPVLATKRNIEIVDIDYEVLLNNPGFDEGLGL